MLFCKSLVLFCDVGYVRDFPLETEVWLSPEATLVTLHLHMFVVGVVHCLTVEQGRYATLMDSLIQMLKNVGHIFLAKRLIGFCNVSGHDIGFVIEVLQSFDFKCRVSLLKDCHREEGSDRAEDFLFALLGQVSD